MKSDDQNFSSFIHVLRQRARPALGAALAVLLGMSIFVFSMPAVYESFATLLIQQGEISPEVLGGTDAREYVEQRLQKTRELVVADNAQALIKKYDLFGQREEALTDDDKLALFNEALVIRPQVTGVVDPRSMRGGELTYAFDAAFQYEDPTVARDVATELASQFTTAGATRTRIEAEKTAKFLTVEVERLQADLRAREARMAEFRQSTGGGRPEDRNINLDRASGLERDLARTDDDLRAAQARRDLLAAQLQSTPRDRPTIDQSGQPVLRGEDRLAAAQQELVAALARYSEDHPDVRRLRREIATLTSETTASPNSGPTNPTYVQLQTQLDAADSAIRDLTSRRYQTSGSLAQVKGTIYQSPETEKQYADLVRDYELIQKQYEQMQTRLASAQMTEKAAGADAAESYVLINPARLPTQPIEPDRFALMFLAVILALAAGLGTASLLNSMDSTVRGGGDVMELMGSAPIGHVPTMRSALELRKRRVNDIALASGMLVTALLVLLAIR